MEPAAVLAVVVKAQGITATNAQLQSVQANLEKTDAAGIAMGKSMQKSGAVMQKAGKAMTKWVTLPILAVGAASATMALNFNRDMSLIRTQAGATAKETSYFKKEILALGGAVKFGPDLLSQALFRVRSAGFKGAEGMRVLREGVNLATVGNSDLEMTTKALTGAAKSLDIHGSKSFRHLAAEMNAAVGTGDMRMEELQSALSTGVLPVFVAAGMTFRDYASALTVMTDRNVPAQMASTRLRTAITMLVPHTEKAEEALAGVGIESEKLATIMRHKGLPQAIAYLAEHLDKFSENKQNRIMIEAFGGAKSSATIEMLVENYKELFLKQKLVGEGIHKYNKEIQVAEHNPLVELQKAWSGLQTDLVRIGEVLTPIIVPAFLKIANAVGSVVGSFSHLSSGSQHAIVYIALLAAAAGPLLRLWGWMTVKTGELIVWLERNNAALGTNAATATEAAAANSELAASLMSVAGAQQELLIANSSGAVTGSVPIAAAATGAETSAASAGMASRFAGGFAAMLPAAFAAVGIGNIISSAVSGDTHGVIFKSGGAIAGAIAGGIAGGLPGALIGAGIGSILGGVIGKMFGGKSLTHMQETMRKQAQHATDVLKNQHKAVAKLHNAEGNLSNAEKRHSQTTEHMRQAHHKLNEVIHKFGPASRQARQAMHELTILEHKNAMSAHGVEHAHRLSGRQLKLYQHETMESVHAEKARLPSIQAVIHHLNKKIKKEEDAGHKGHHYWQLMHRVTQKEEEEGKIRTKIQHLIAEAAQVSGKKFAKALREISSEQANLGKHFHGIQIGARHVKESMEQFATKGALANKHFIASTAAAKIAFHGDAVKISDTTGIAVHTIETRLAHALEKMGVAAVGFHVKNTGKEHHGGKHQTGGPITVPGNTAGDKVHLSAMVEPHEVIHVLNSRASKDMKKLGALERLNQMTPRHRFAEGGAMGGTAAAMREAVRINKQHFPYVWGGGHGSFSGPYDCSGAVSAVLHAGGWLNSPMVSGELASFGKPGPGPITVYANAEHAFMSIMGKPFGTSGSNPGGGAGFFPKSVFDAERIGGDAAGPFAVRHPVGAGTLARAIRGVEVTGPPGTWTTLGNDAAKASTLAANKYLQKHAPGGKWGGGNAALESLGKGSLNPLKWAQIMLGVGFPAVARVIAEGLGVLQAESNFDPSNIAQGPSGHIGAWAESPAFGSTKARLDPVQSTRAALRVGWSPTHSFWPAWGRWETGETGGAGPTRAPQFMKTAERAIQMTHGGRGASFASASKKKDEPSVISSSMKGILHGLHKGKHLPKFRGKLKRLGRRINSFGLSDKQMKRLEHLQDLTQKVQRVEEAADNASALNLTDEEGNITQGLFQGKTEGAWRQAQLAALLRLRGAVVSEYKTDAPQLPFIKKLEKEAHARLRVIRKAIREAEQEKRILEKQIKAIEKAESSKKHELEKEIKELEHAIEEARRNVPPSDKKHKGAHEAAENRINEMERIKEAKKKVLEHSGADSTKEIRELHKKISNIEGAQKGRGRVEKALTGTIIPDLDAKKESVAQLLQGMLGEAGEVEGRGKHISFTGLKAIQGAGVGLGKIGNPPPLGTVGGEIFTVENRLREIQEELKKTHETTPTSEAAEDEVAKQEAEEWKKRFIVSQYQYKVLSEYPSVQSLAYPFAGAFAKGGVLMAEVGEKGREVIAAPQGSRVVSRREVDSALRGGGHPTHLNFEEINFHEADQKVTGRVNGSDFEAEVKTVNRKAGRKAANPSPGSRRR